MWRLDGIWHRVATWHRNGIEMMINLISFSTWTSFTHFPTHWISSKIDRLKIISFCHNSYAPYWIRKIPYWIRLIQGSQLTYHNWSHSLRFVEFEIHFLAMILCPEVRITPIAVELPNNVYQSIVKPQLLSSETISNFQINAC